MKTAARSTGVDPKTARRYIRAAEQAGLVRERGVGELDDERFFAILARLKSPPTRPDSEGRSLCEEHKEFIKSKLGQRVRLTKVHRLLQRQGALINYSMLYRFAVEELEFGKKGATAPVVDGEPGRELQLDTGQFLLPEADATGRRKRVKAFIFTPNVSRYRFVYVAERETTEDAIKACEAAWEFYGGIFEVLLVDNTKAMIAKADPSRPELENWRLIGRGEGIHWADVDEDISIDSLLLGQASGESQSSLQKWLQSRAATG